MGISGLRHLAAEVVAAGKVFTPHTWGNGIGLMANLQLTAGTVGAPFIEWPLDAPEWSAERIREAMHAGAEKHVKLKTSIPVFLGYWTARVRPDNTVQFRKDVYEVDGKLQARLNDRLARLRRSGEAAAVATTVSNEAASEKPAKKPKARPAGKK